MKRERAHSQSPAVFSPVVAVARRGDSTAEGSLEGIFVYGYLTVLVRSWLPSEGGTVDCSHSGPFRLYEIFSCSWYPVCFSCGRERAVARPNRRMHAATPLRRGLQRACSACAQQPKPHGAWPAVPARRSPASHAHAWPSSDAPPREPELRRCQPPLRCRTRRRQSTRPRNASRRWSRADGRSSRCPARRSECTA